MAQSHCGNDSHLSVNYLKNAFKLPAYQEIQQKQVLELKNLLDPRTHKKLHVRGRTLLSYQYSQL